MFHSLLKIQKFFEALYQSLVSVLRVLLRLRFSSGFKHIKAPANEIFILGNGPSLRPDLDQYGPKISNCNSMGVNMFVLSDEFVKIKPKYYVILDINFFVEKVILQRVKEAREKMLDAFRDKLNWEIVLFIPVEGKNSLLKSQLSEANLPIKFIFFNRTVIYGLKSISHFMYSRGWGMPPPQNVLIGALMTAIQTGFKNIYIIGADHSWHEDIHVDTANGLELTDRHFYNPKGNRIARLDGETLKRLKISDLFTDLARTFRSHEMLQEYARSKDIEIINASSISYIDAYKKIKLEDLPWDQLLDK
jgi:hypothetical protein